METLDEQAVMNEFPAATKQVYEVTDRLQYATGTDAYDDAIADAESSFQSAGGAFYDAFIKSNLAVENSYFGLPTEPLPDTDPQRTEELNDAALEDVEDVMTHLHEGMSQLDDIMADAAVEEDEFDTFRDQLADAESDYQDAVTHLGYCIMESKEGMGTKNLGPQYEPLFLEE